MATSINLTGVGMPPSQAVLLGNDPQALTCTGTAQGTAAAILTKNVTLTAASSQTGAILPSGASVGAVFYINCASSTAGVVYAPSGHTLTNVTAATSASNGSATLAQYKAGIVYKASQTSATVAVWVYGALA